MAKKFAIILAGGEGRRAGGSLPKQFVEICGRPVVCWSVDAFIRQSSDWEIILVIHPGFFDEWDIIFKNLPKSLQFPHHVACGGRCRVESVANGLSMAADLTIQAGIDLATDSPVVAIHDGARPLLSPGLICKLLLEVQPQVGILPAVRPVSSLRFTNSPENPFEFPDSVIVDRKNYLEVQTPQAFLLNDLLDTFRRIKAMPGQDHSIDVLNSFTDDASVFSSDPENKILMVEGDPDNIKITNPKDFIIAEALLNHR